jgi:hypothetical protein
MPLYIAHEELNCFLLSLWGQTSQVEQDGSENARLNLNLGGSFTNFDFKLPAF